MTSGTSPKRALTAAISSMLACLKNSDKALKRSGVSPLAVKVTESSCSGIACERRLLRGSSGNRSGGDSVKVSDREKIRLILYQTAWLSVSGSERLSGTAVTLQPIAGHGSELSHKSGSPKALGNIHSTKALQLPHRQRRHPSRPVLPASSYGSNSCNRPVYILWAEKALLLASRTRRN